MLRRKRQKSENRYGLVAISSNNNKHDKHSNVLKRRANMILKCLYGLAAAIVLGGIVALYLAGLFPASIFAPLVQKVGLVNLSFIYPTTENYANSERLAHWVAGLLMFRDHPLMTRRSGAKTWPKNLFLFGVSSL